MLVVEEDWEGGVVTKERYFNLWTKLRECINFPAALYLRSVCRQIRRDSFINGLRRTES